MHYQSKLNLIDTEIAIKLIKDTFETKLYKKLNLLRVSAPLIVSETSGLNDHLSGVERIVTFTSKNSDEKLEIVQSLAKWKRVALKRYDILYDSGIYTDMNAIRCDEDLDYTHSLYVDQWDWEKHISEDERTLKYLFAEVNKIYEVLKETNTILKEKYPNCNAYLPSKIFLISSEELLKLYPNLSPVERENEITKLHKAVFVYQIGWPLSNGLPHGSRAADYDDWHLNGDVLVWHEPLQKALELSSMGIRVNKDSLLKQLKHKNENFKLKYQYSQNIVDNTLPLSIGGGIGQSRLCMFLLEKKHIGEVQASYWDDEAHKLFEKENLNIL